MSFLKGKLGRAAGVVAFTLGAFQALSIVGATSASAASLPTCSFSGGTVTVSVPDNGDTVKVYQDENGGIHVAGDATGGNVEPLVDGTQDLAGCTGVQFGVATTTTINITGGTGVNAFDQSVWIEMDQVLSGCCQNDVIVDWGTINWTVNLGNNTGAGDSLNVGSTGDDHDANVDIAAGANGIDLNNDGNLDVTVANVENFYFFTDAVGPSLPTQGANIDLSGSTATGGPFTFDATIEDLHGGNGNDTIQTFYGGSGDDTIIANGDIAILGPGLGNDNVTCGAGVSNTLDYSNTATAINANLATNTVTQGTDLDTVTGCDNVIGTAQGDTLTGDAGDNVFTPGAGNDTVTGGDNNGVVTHSATPSGGDTYDVSDATTGVTVDLGAGTSTGGSGTDTLSGMENVVGTAAADSITGSSGDNLLWGGSGNDTLAGGAGDGDGSDYFDGGSGIDTIDYGNNTLTTNVDVDDVPWGDGNGTAADDDVIAGHTIENAILGSGDDSFFGSEFNNRVWPNGGQDALVGNGGIDTVDLSMGYTTGQTINLSGGGATGGSALSITGFTNAVGTAFNDTIIGTDVVVGTNGANLLVGGKGNDSISGNAGPDLVKGGAGNDVIRGGNGDDDLLGSGGNDNIRGGNGDDNIKGGKGKDKCIGGGGRDIVKCEKAQKSRIRSARIARLSRI